MAKRKKKSPVERLLDRYFLARVGSSAAVIDTETAKDGLPFLTEAAFKQLHRHWPPIGNIYVTTLWATDPRRQVFEKGVTFDPSGAEKKGVFNLWKGFPITPVEGDCNVFIQFLWRDICGEDEENFEYLMTFFAHLVQYGPVALSCRPKCSFKPPFVRRRQGFSSPMLSGGDADYRSH